MCEKYSCWVAVFVSQGIGIEPYGSEKAKWTVGILGQSEALNDHAPEGRTWSVGASGREEGWLGPGPAH